MNKDIKQAIYNAGLKQWQVAVAIGISERTLITWLRTELSEERRNRITAAMEQLCKGRAV